MTPYQDLGQKQLFGTIVKLMEENFDLGRVIRIKEVLGGYCNKSYAVWMSAIDGEERFFLRLYQPNAVESEILFEHALLNHLRSNGFTLAAAIVPSRNGTTVIKTPATQEHWGKTALWALFEFLDGEDKYSWTETDLTDSEFISAAEVLAHLHHCSHGFVKPPNANRVQPRIMEFLPTFEWTFSAFLKLARDRKCDQLFKENFQSIRNALEIAVSYDMKLKGMAQLAIHCDYHPGNLKYRNGRCVGLFDFDWSKIDYRLFDVALALVYFTSIWRDQAAGLRLDKFSLFLNAYNDACHRFAHISPLTAQERRYLVPMLSIANLYVLNWDLVDFYSAPDPNDLQYYGFCDHNIGLMHWIESHQDEIEQVEGLLP
jgi:homoserine kinase type II